MRGQAEKSNRHIIHQYQVTVIFEVWEPMGLFTTKTPSYLFRESHNKDETRRSHLCNGNSYTVMATFFFTRGQFWPSGIVVACMCVSVCQSVCQSLVCPRDNSGPVQARITNLDQGCKRPWLMSLLFWEAKRCKRPWLRSIFIFIFFLGGGN